MGKKKGLHIMDSDEGNVNRRDTAAPSGPCIKSEFNELTESGEELSRRLNYFR